MVGLDAPDDAAVYRITPDLALVQTVDFFSPVVDDPGDWGRIAAANALSDVYAMGGRPVTALNLVGWPRDLGFEVLGRVLDGAGETCAEAEVEIVGGHSIDDPEPKFGLAVTGTVHPDRIVRARGAGPGCDLVLTKPLGTGIVSSGIKAGRASEDVISAAIASMAALNRGAAEAMLEAGPRAATDVTGFGLTGHLLEMLGDGLAAELDAAAIPVLSGALELAGAGVWPRGTGRNMEAARQRVTTDGVDEALAVLLFDAQTSGGLLIAVEEPRTARLLQLLSEQGVGAAARIGRVVEGSGTIRVRA